MADPFRHDDLTATEVRENAEYMAAECLEAGYRRNPLAILQGLAWTFKAHCWVLGVDPSAALDQLMEIPHPGDELVPV